MILKDYQQAALNDLEDFLTILDDEKSLTAAYKKFWEKRDVPAKPPYQNNISGVPQVCFKVPTGGGKTFMAVASLKPIFQALPPMQTKFVVWLVPSETILTQTYKNLNDPAHPYRKYLNVDFDDRVSVYTKEQLLMGENFSPATVANHLSILVFIYDSFRTHNKEGRKAYQQNGQLYPFISHFRDDEEILEDTDKCSLIQVIRHYNPIIIVDESHHTSKPLSVEMLKNFNPSFILELTATPKKSSNVIAYVPAAKLKAAGMVKLPVIVYNRHTQKEVIADAIEFRGQLEKSAASEKIRPIVLFQAESKGNDKRATFDKIKADLIQEHKIPEDQIAIKIAEINDLKNVDLMAADCPIRYIITINALQEGWDCPFAYILASLANRSSPVDVEQILGRILRRPFTKNFTDEYLNMSYVFTSAEDFRKTLDNIVLGLNAAGFSEKEFRAVEDTEPSFDGANPPQTTAEQQKLFPSTIEYTLEGKSEQTGNFTYTLASAVTYTSAYSRLEEMKRQAIQSSEDYKISTGTTTGNIRSVEEREKMAEFPMREKFKDAQNILLPQFFCSEDMGLLFEGFQDRFVSKENFSENFSLDDKDIQINFDNLHYDIVSLDIQDKEDFPTYKYLSEFKVKKFLEHFDKLSRETQVEQCAINIAKIVDKYNYIATQKINPYVKRIVSTFDRERLRDAIQHQNLYARRIKDKIDDLFSEFAMENFSKQINKRKIFTKPNYKFLPKTSPIHFQKSWANSLYTAEEEVNDFEYKVAAALTSLDNVLWWHRNRVNKEEGFFINGFINHYPDFIVKLKSGIILLVESKGDDRDNSDSKRKLTLGKKWEDKADSNRYGYFMVFDNKPLYGALSFDDFISNLREM